MKSSYDSSNLNRSELINIITLNRSLRKKSISPKPIQSRRTISLTTPTPVKPQDHSTMLSYMLATKKLSSSIQTSPTPQPYPRVKLPFIRPNRILEKDEEKKKPVFKIKRKRFAIQELRKVFDKQHRALEGLMVSAVKDFGVDASDLKRRESKQEGTNLFDKFFGENGFEEEEKLINTVALFEQYG